MEKEGPRNLTRSYFSHSIGVILVFNKGDIATLYQLHEWMNQARTHCSRDNILFSLWCNDRGDTDNPVSDEAIQDFIYSAELSPDLVFEISAKRIEDTEHCTGVNESYQKVIEAIHRENRRAVSLTGFGSSHSDKTSLLRSGIDSGAFTGPSLQSSSGADEGPNQPLPIEQPAATDNIVLMENGEQRRTSVCPVCSMI